MQLTGALIEWYCGVHSLAAQLRVAEGRAREAEEETMRAEQVRDFAATPV